MIEIECPSCNYKRQVYPSTKKQYKYNACIHCKNKFAANTRFGHIIWYYICISNRIKGPYRTIREAKNNAPDWRHKHHLVSFNKRTDKSKTSKGKSLSSIQNSILKAHTYINKENLNDD